MIDKIAFDRLVFTDPELNSRFKSEGYVIVKGFLSENEVERLATFYEEHPSERRTGFHTTLHDSRPDYRESVTNEVNDVFYPKAQKLLVGYEPVFSCFTVKEQDAESGFDLHLDWSMVDEKQFTSVTIWSPLTDITDTNGLLWVLPGSHQFEYTIRGGPGLRLWCEKPAHECSQRFSILELKLAKGDAIIYDHRLFHGSPPNQSNQRRVAINYSSIPIAAESLHYLFNGDSEVRSRCISPNYYHHHILDYLENCGLYINRKEIGGSFLTQSDVNTLVRD
ncbi:MAG: phytanoyl-CoA dioxygenase family protein [Flavobacteriales bacterium]|nr:phytanoyl-CoA dioxygenase family protein [Flavobacteriales bacterium]